jgi:glycosyltransferase involved in cell wall biosynthesis
MRKNTAQKHIVIDARIRRSSTGRYVDRLLEHLQDIDHHNSYTVLLQADDQWKPKATNFSSLIAPFSQFSFNPLDQIRFAAQLYSLHADLVHFPMNQQPVLYFGKVVTSTLDLTMLRFTRPGRTPLPIFWFKMLGYRFLFWYSNRRSKAVITISHYVQRTLAKKYRFTAKKTTTTYCASEPPLKIAAKRPAFADAGIDFLLYVGAAFPHKNLTALVNALPLLEDQPKLKIVLVGKKEYYYHKLTKIVAAKPFADRIIITGFLSDAELKWLYQHCKAYVFPSLSEGFGLPGLEAMVHGAPVVSSNATCLPEIYGDAALYFNPRDLEDIAQKIDRVLTNEAFRQELIERGHKQAANYSWQRMAEETLEVYRKVLT